MLASLSTGENKQKEFNRDFIVANWEGKLIVESFVKFS